MMTEVIDFNDFRGEEVENEVGEEDTMTGEGGDCCMATGSVEDTKEGV